MSPIKHANLRASCVGNNIRKAREASGITQLALAHLIGWAGPDAGAQISRFESGQKEPRISTLVKIASALGVKLETLIMEVDMSGLSRVSQEREEWREGQIEAAKADSMRAMGRISDDFVIGVLVKKLEMCKDALEGHGLKQEMEIFNL